MFRQLRYFAPSYYWLIDKSDALIVQNIRTSGEEYGTNIMG